LGAWSHPKRIPKRQRPDQDQDSRKENADETQRGAAEPVGRGLDHEAEIGREAEERTGHSLGRAISCQKRIVAHPAGADERFAQQRQHDMAAAEHQRARAVERGEQIDTRQG